MSNIGRKVNLDLLNLFIAIVSLVLTYQMIIMTLAKTDFEISIVHFFYI